MRAKGIVFCKVAVAGLFRAACTPLKPLQRSDVLLMFTHLAFPGLRDRLLPAIKPESYSQLSFSKVSGRIEKSTSLSCTATEVQRCSGCQSISSFPSTGVPRPARHCLFIPRPICKVSSVQWIEFRCVSGYQHSCLVPSQRVHKETSQHNKPASKAYCGGYHSGSEEAAEVA